MWLLKQGHFRNEKKLKADLIVCFCFFFLQNFLFPFRFPFFSLPFPTPSCTSLRRSLDLNTKNDQSSVAAPLLLCHPPLIRHLQLLLLHFKSARTKLPGTTRS